MGRQAKGLFWYQSLRYFNKLSLQPVVNLQKLLLASLLTYKFNLNVSELDPRRDKTQHSV